jgi:hypothetical protein
MKPLLLTVLWAFSSFSALAHPGSGIVVDSQGNVFVADINRGAYDRAHTAARRTVVHCGPDREARARTDCATLTMTSLCIGAGAGEHRAERISFLARKLTFEAIISRMQ